MEKADEAITHYPTIIDGTWYVWDVAAEAYVDTGVEAQGAKGDPGADGTSPTVTVTAITGGHRVTITDASGAHTFDVLDGEDGTTPTVDLALSPTSENPVQNKVIDAALTDVMEDLSQLQTDVDGKVDDVKVGGRGVVTDGVAEIPIATNNNDVAGVVKLYNAYGIQKASNDYLQINKASDSEVKAGANTTKPLVPYNQHESTFYGLTKAAGVDMANSSNAVGTYTDEAKAAIQEMIGVSGDYSLVADLTTTEEITSVDGITVTFPHLTKEIIIDADIKASTGQTNLYFVLINENGRDVIGLAMSSQIATTAKHTISEILRLSDRYVRVRFQNTVSGLPPLYGGLNYLNGGTAKGFSSVIIRPQNANANIPVGSVIRVFAR